MTQFHRALPWKPTHGPVEDTVFWGYASYGVSFYSKVPLSDVVKGFMRKLHIHDVELAWHC